MHAFAPRKSRWLSIGNIAALHALIYASAVCRKAGGEQWDVFWSQVYWLAAISLAALPLVSGIWTDAQGTGWLRALEEHYRELVAYTILLTAIATADSLLAAQMAWRHSSVVPVAAAVIFIGSFLLLAIELLGVFMTIDRLPIYLFPLIIGWRFFAKTTAAQRMEVRRCSVNRRTWSLRRLSRRWPSWSQR